MGTSFRQNFPQKKSYTLENKHKHKHNMNIYELYVDSFCI